MTRVSPVRRALSVTVSLVVSAWVTGGLRAAPEGEEGGRSFPVAAEATAFVGRFDRTELVKDEVFVKALKELAESGLSPEARADAFALMQERIGWLFVGAARVFPNTGYAQTVALMFSTYFGYQEKMPPGLNVGPLLELARTSRGKHPLRASNALLLATILNHEAAKDAVRKAVDAKAVGAASVPAIDLHNLCLAVMLTRDVSAVRAVLDLLPGVASEESREDVIAVVGVFRDDESRDRVEAFVRKSYPGLFDNSVRTALIVLAHAGPPEHFRTFYKALGDGCKDGKDVERLSKFWDSGFRDTLQADNAAGSPLKIWDGFTLTLKNQDGGSITDGKGFRCWISFR